VKTPAKKATKAAAKAPAKVAAPSKKVSAKSPVKAKATPAKAKAAPAKAKKGAVTPAKAPAKKAVAAKTPVKKAVAKKPTAVKKPAAKQAPVAKVAKPAKKAVAAPKAAAQAKPAVKAKPEVKAKPSAKALPLKAVPAPVASAPVAVVPAAASDLPVRSSRPSARLAQITVPSMPQAVASTAAKASFLPSMSTTVLPVPAAPAKKDPKLANNWKNKPVDQLTDAEVLAMPDSEYMNDAQMAFFRLKLVQLKQGILNNAGETTEHLREDTVVVPDPADRATIEEEHALELRTRDRERKLLKKIEQSIARIDAGDYGYCDETGEPIGVGRLLARPTATLSLEAQQRRELKQKMFGD
jgi:DnaK suppressor protein